MSSDNMEAKDKEALESSSCEIDRQIAADDDQIELSGLLRISSHNATNASGQSDYDYPTLATQVPALASLPYVGSFKHTPLPPELLEHFDQMQCNCAMGVFADIGRAWLTIDSNIYVWNYNDGSDLAYFDGLNEVILSVGLVRPKPGVFQGHIVYLLVLATPVEIVVLGVSFSGSQEDVLAEMHLLPEPLFTLPSDNVAMLSICGTLGGRVFLAGKDGCLYEIAYQAEEGWFYRRCRKINHSTSVMSYILPSFLSFSEQDSLEHITVDESRHILYTLSSKGAIHVYDLGSEGRSVDRVAAMSLDAVVHRAVQATKLNDRKLFQPLIHISAIPDTDSSTLHFMAVSQAGVRFYFTTTPNGVKSRPSILALVHVRLPPGYTPSSSSGPKMGTAVHQAFTRRGSLLLAVKQSDNQDFLWIVDSDLFPFQNLLMESRVIVPVDGRVWSLTEGPDPFTPITSENPLPPSVVTQHAAAQREFVLLTAQGCFSFTKLKPVDQLQYLLDRQSDDEIQSFFHLHKEAQSCAMCLIIATRSEDQTALAATDAFFRFGGEPRMVFPKPTHLGTQAQTGLPPPTNQLASPTTVGSQTSAAGHGTLGKAIVGPEVVLSGKYSGLCLYLARLLRPFWGHLVMQTHINEEKKEEFHSRLHSEELAVYGKELEDLKDFLDNNPHLCSKSESAGGNTGNIHQQWMGFMKPDSMFGDSPAHVQQGQVEAQRVEQRSLHFVYRLVNMCCECVSLWRLLCEGNVSLVAERLNSSDKADLKQLTFKNLVVKGKSLSSELIRALLDVYIGDSNMTDTLTSRLRESCPTLFGEDDAIVSKAHEQIVLAKPCEDRHMKASMLRESLKLFSKVTKKLDLACVCMEYQTAQYYEGVVELCLCAASHVDEKDIALHYYRKGLPQDDTESRKVYDERVVCYTPVLNMLKALHQACYSGPSVQSPVPLQPGPPVPLQPQANPEAEFESTLSYSLRAHDPLFHFSLYHWMIKSNLTDRLVQVESPYVEEYLQQSISSDHQTQLLILDLLWKYYERTRKYGSAARILSKLAEGEGPHFNLNERVEYLSRAVMCAKSTTMSTNTSKDGEFLHELEEKMDVARIQVFVLSETEKLANSTEKRDAITLLNSQLMDVTTLYGDFADELDLHECKLAILHCAGHYDAGLVESLWRSIISEVLRQCVGGSVDVMMRTVRTKILSLGQLYGQSERYFPVGFLLKVLEMQSCRLGWSVEFVQETLRKVGVPMEALLPVYDRLIKANEPFWSGQGKPLHLYWVFQSLVDSFLSSPSIVPLYEKNRFIGHMLGLLSDYIVRMETMDPSVEKLNQTLSNYRSHQSRLEKLSSS
jgi:nuclear pore complex protein Nup155